VLFFLFSLIAFCFFAFLFFFDLRLSHVRGGLAEGSLFEALKPTDIKLDIKALEEMFCQPEKVEKKDERPSMWE
jgi:hypothetical protein